MWGLAEMLQLAQTSKVIYYDACCHGGKRRKRQCLMYNCCDLTPLALDCQNDHPHLPYGVDEAGWDTAKEAEYPKLFCERVAAQFALALKAKTEALDLKGPVARAAAKAFSGQQSNKNKIPNIISEYKQTLVIPLTQEPAVNDKKHTLHELRHNEIVIPAGSKLLEIRSGENSQELTGALQYVFGIYRSPVEWHAEACKVMHPSDTFGFLKPWQSLALSNLLSHSREQVSEHRLRAVKRLQERRSALKEQEA